MIQTLEPIQFKFANRIEELAYEFLDKTLNPDILFYESLTFNSIGGTYKPDFLAVYKNHLYFFEVKSSWNSPGATRTKRSMKEVGQIFGFMGHFIAMLPERKHQKNKLIYVDEWRFEILSEKRFRRITLEEIL